MVQKISDFSTSAYLSVKNGVSNLSSNLKNDESGMEVVQVVILVVIGMLLIFAVYAAMTGILETVWEGFTTTTSSSEDLTMDDNIFN